MSRKQLDVALFLTSQIILIIVSIPAFVPKPAQLITLSVAGWYFCRVIFTQTTGDVNGDFGFGSAIIVQYMLALDYALLTPPENLKELHDKNPTRVTERPLKNRVLWALKLFSNPRGIGWAHEPSCLPARPSPLTPSSTFVISRILLATFCFLVAGGAHLFDTALYADMTTADKLLTGAPLHQRVLGVLSFGFGGVSSLAGLNAILSAVIVGCGFSSPERWPLIFGSPLRLWSIRRFWRRFWHQLIRRSVLTSTSAILGFVCPEKYVGTTGYKFARLYIAFGISGLAHTGGDVMASGKLGFNSLTFFMLQPFGITIELVVSHLWYRLQNNDDNPKISPADEYVKTIERAPANHHTNGNKLINTRKSLAKDSIPPLWIRCAGSIWLALWMLWSGAYIVDALYSARLSALPGQV